MKSIQLKKMTEADAVIKESIRRTSKTHCIGGKQFPFLSLLWDAWSKSKKGYFGVGGIWYDPKLRENIYAVLGVKFFQGSHKAVDCQSLLLQCFSKYAILNSYVHLSIADGAGNVQNVCYESGDPKKQQLFPIRYCICHLLQTVILHALGLKKYKRDKSNKNLDDLWSIVRKLLHHFSCRLNHFNPYKSRIRS